MLLDMCMRIDMCTGPENKGRTEQSDATARSEERSKKRACQSLTSHLFAPLDSHSHVLSLSNEPATGACVCSKHGAALQR